jgi:hypothetical protein
MQPGQNSPKDESIWEMSCDDIFMPPPRQWTFQDKAVKFGSDLYPVDGVTLYELALLDVHSQYWETTCPVHVRRYHRGLQYNVEYSFRSAGPATTYCTPTFLKGWLVRVIFMKLHDRNGRRMVEDILKNVSMDQRLKLETGNFQENGIFLFSINSALCLDFTSDWKTVFSHKHHHAELSKMIQTICSERQISRNDNTGFSWSLPIFDAIKCENHSISTPLDHNPALLYKYEVMDKKWEGILESSSSLIWKIRGVPFKKAEVRQLLHGKWLSDEVINAYLLLCGYLRPDIKFLPTPWFTFLKGWGLNASNNSVNWVSLLFHLHQT